MRVFVAIGSSRDYTAINISISESLINSTVSNLLHSPSLSKPLIPLTSFEGVQTNNSISEFLNEAGKWFFADFVVHYDPCICFYHSLVKIQVKLVENSIISLSGIEDGTIVSIQDGQGQLDNNSIYKINSFPAVIDAGKQAVASYQTYNQSVNDANNLIDKYIDAGKKNEQDVEKNKEKDGLKPLVNFLVGPNSIARDLSKAIPYIGAVMSIYDFFTTTPKEDPGLKIAVPPLAIRSNITLNGSIYAVYNYKEIQFWNPGSDNLLLDEDDYPYYNQVLGTFNLLKPLEISFYSDKEILSITEYPLFWETIYTVYEEAGYQVTSDLKYVINPAAGITLDVEDIDIFGSLVFEYESYFENAWIDLDTLDDFFVSDDANSFRTQYVPFQCFSQMKAIISSGIRDEIVPNWWGIPYEMHIIPDKVFLKLIVRMKKSQLDNYVIYVGKFPVKINIVSKPSTPLSSIYLTIPKFAEYDNTLLDEDIRVWDYVELGPDIYFMGCNLITAGNYINVKPGTNLEPNISLKISQPVDCNEEKYGPASSSEIYSFCHSEAVDGYKPEQRENYKGSEPNDTSGSSWKFKDEIYQVKPNPARDEIFVGFTLSAKSTGKIILVDILGNVVKEFHNEDQMNLGYNSRLLDLKDVPPGVYMCVIVTQYSRINTKIIKI